MPGTLPVVGDALFLLHDPIGFLTGLPRHGDLARLRLGPMPVIVVCTPDLAQQVLRDDRTFDKGGPFFDRMRDLLGEAVATCPHSKHRRLRRLVQPAFRDEQLRRYRPVMRAEAERLADGWSDGQHIDVMAATMTYTTRLALRTLFSVSLTEERLTAAVADIETWVAGVPLQMLLPPGAGRLPLPANRHYRDAIAGLRATIASAVEERRRHPLDTREPDLLSSMIVTQDSEDRSGRLSDTELIDHAATFLAAGTETSATALAWMFHLLALHPQVQRDLRTELAGREDHAADRPGHDDGSLCHRVVLEALRLHAPAWLLTRTVTEHAILNGIPLEEGATVAYSAYPLHRNAAYFPDPHAFRPDRWTDRTPQPGTFLTFGGGPRSCVGHRFAMLELTAALRAVVAAWELQPLGARPPRPRLGATLAPRGLRLRVRACT
ncbi:cytochrome P450 [Kitasatospora sp. NPDC057692]|uniref:cytochrome P450 n=1 Tax=Kitasatospora sp. NPDC057692 TaxID=3346215 RepID=UPI0036A2607B